MPPVRKAFDPKVHDKYDEPAREASKEYVSKMGYDCKDNPDIYGVDLISHGNCYVECECKTSWSGASFPYSTLHIPERKEKFCKLDMPCIFLIWNREMTHAMRVHSGLLQKKLLTEVPNKYVPRGEMFFRIPTNLIKIIER